MKTSVFSRACCALLCCVAAPAAELVTHAVLGNSGGAGATLVRCSSPVPNLGVVVDGFGTLWERAGKGRLNRYAVDGRLLASFAISPASGARDRAALAGDDLVLLLDGKLFRLPIDASPGTAPTAIPLPRPALGLAPRAWKGRVLVGDEEAMRWVDPRTGRIEPAGPGAERIDSLEVDEDGTPILVSRSRAAAYPSGSTTPAWNRGMSGGRAQKIDGAWYSQNYHSTIHRLAADLSPDPGVVLGGNSGSFIGHVAENPEILFGRGMARLGGDEWVVSAAEGALHVLRWDESQRQFRIVRRIGGLPEIDALAIDEEGHVSLGSGFWNWDDLPDAPQREAQGAVAVAIADLGKARFGLLGLYAGQARYQAGPLPHWERVSNDQKDGARFAVDTIGAAALSAAGGMQLVAATATGKGYAATLQPNGTFRDWLGEVPLALAEPALRGWTSLSRWDDGLLATVGGWIVLLDRDGTGWKERERWRTWGEAPTQAFGPAVRAAVDGDRLWVSDAARSRLVCFERSSRRVIAEFGTVDVPGDDLGHLREPGRIAARGQRCVVHDAGNSRLLTLELR